MNRLIFYKKYIRPFLWLPRKLVFHFLDEIYKFFPALRKILLFRISRSFTRILGSEYKPNLNVVQLDVTWNCNLACSNCGRACGLVPTKEIMPLEQIRKFIQECVNKNRMWKKISLIGGEPTLHPDIFEIVDLFLSYKQKYAPRTFICLYTNGYGAQVNEVLEILEKKKGLVIFNSSKKGPLHKFRSVNWAPVDLEEYKNADFRNACGLSSRCGLTLTKYGYYPCPVGGTVDRIFGFNIGRKNVPLKKDTMQDQFDILCRYCGNFKRFDLTTKKQMTSDSWIKAIKKYKKNPPKLTLY